MPNDPDKIQQRETPGPAAWDALLLGLGRDIERVSDRLRGLSDARLAAAAPPYASRAEAARATAQTLADAAAGLEAERDAVVSPEVSADAGREVGAPVWRELPELIDLSAGDQLAVTGHDLLVAARPSAPDDHVWARHGRRTAHVVLAEAADTLAALRRLL
jgi:hypothetical protein